MHETATIAIDRLVLTIPGLDSAQAAELARRIGSGLAAAHSTAPLNSRGSLSLELAPHLANAGVPQLAEAIVRSLLPQLRRR